MREIVAELKSLRLHGMAQRYEDLLAEGDVGIERAGWLMQCLLEAEVTDRHVRSIRYRHIVETGNESVRFQQSSQTAKACVRAREVSRAARPVESLDATAEPDAPF
ncbi:P-loop NTPase family protein [Aromatoleum toluclasticum]|uniref:hypothetical protein n=1 Tax=Aromatoleum toluclasticum TaxID=92003 RepID=UPI000367F422|nr:hypothetical protein [Aromatoleum toluclasticum]